MLKNFPHRKKSAFTLIELLLVIGIIAVLAAIVILAVNPMRQLAQARNAARQSDSKEVMNAIQQYVIHNGSTPPGVDTSPRMLGTDATGCDVSCGSLLGPPNPFTTTVTTGSDDAEEEVATDDLVYISSTDLEMVQDYDPSRGNQITGIRFQNITIPRGAVIANASIRFKTSLDDGGGSEPTSLTITGQDSDDAATFSIVANNISVRPKTSAVVAWNSIPPWTIAGEIHDTPDLSTVLKEIVDRTGWVSGNDMVFIIEGTGRRPAYTYEESPALAPILNVTYQVIGITASACLNLHSALSGTYLAGIPKDPRYGSATKSYYAIQKLSSSRIHVEACGAELGEAIGIEQ